MSDTHSISLSPPLASEIVTEILAYLPIMGIKKKKLQTLTSFGSLFREALQPFLFRHLNLARAEDLSELAQLFTSADMGPHAINLAKGVHTLQISINMDDRDVSVEPEDLEILVAVWELLHKWLPRMTQLHTLTICFDEDDQRFLHRFLKKAPLAQIPTLRKLHCLSFHTETSTIQNYKEGDRFGPWGNLSAWSRDLCSQKLQKLEHIIVSTPTMPFWPPSWKEAGQLRENWFGGLGAASKLRTFVLHCGYADENGQLEPYESGDISDADVPPGLLGEYCTNMHGGTSTPGDLCVPVVGWSRCPENGQWSEDDKEVDHYCGLGEHLFFDPLRLEETQKQLYGHEVNLFASMQS
ncbi:hypothetical protein B0H13DRAFT_2365966 [Mycena leptocephala]|nr:hypothetical protein B0H13DRAFT_2365966 [Mycena leptocephala]